jgi:chromosome segregation protein
MYLKEVIINGFKSFADKTRIVLQPGVTCIVGPNGCGKSNIVDAIRWVLGEQSAKALRGGKMHDVIFAGTDQRKSLGMCEVTLTFTDCEKDLGTAFNEVSITRQVTVDGGSSYFLNGNPCRLKDIHALFMDTGIGRVSYSFMVQGQIDQILSTNPAERRVIFEEAAGITRYKSQRKEALGKLALVDQNLSRVNDVTEEVGRQIGTLKRQAGKALRYKRIKHRLTHLDLAYNAHRFSNRMTVVEDSLDRTQKLRQAVEARADSLKEREALLEGARVRRNQLYQELESLQQTVFELRSQKEEAQRSAEYSNQRIQDLKERTQALRTEIQSLTQEQQTLDQREREEALFKQEQLSLVGSSDEMFRMRNTEVLSLEEKLAQAESTINSAKRDLLMLENEQTRLNNDTTQFEIELKTAQAKRISLSESIQELQNDKTRAENSLRELNEQVTQFEEEKAQKQTALEQAQQAVTAAKQQFRTLQEQSQALERTLARQKAELDLLKDLQAKFEGFSEGAKAILQGKLTHLLPNERFSLLTQQLEIDPAYANALETILGAASEAILLERTDDLESLADALYHDKLGKACLHVSLSNEHTQHIEAQYQQNTPEWLVSATQCVKVKNQNFASPVRSLLNGYFFAPTLNQFVQFWKSNPSFHFQAVVTENGEFIDSRGLVYVGKRSAPGKEPSYLQRETEIKKLISTIETLEADRVKLSGQIEQSQKDLDTTETNVETNRSELIELGQELSSLQGQVQSAQKNLDAVLGNFGRLERQLEDLESQEVNRQDQLDQAQGRHEQVRQLLQQKKDSLSSVEAEIQVLRSQRDDLRETLSNVRVELAQKKQTLETLDRGLSEIDNRRRDIAERLERDTNDISSIETQISDLHIQIELSHETASKSESALQSKLSNLDESRQGMMEAEEKMLELEHTMSAERTQQHSQETELNGLEVRLAEERSQLQFIAEKVQAEHQLEIGSIDWKEQLWKATEEFDTTVDLDELNEDETLDLSQEKERGDPTAEDLEAFEKTDWNTVATEIKELRDRIHSMGAINLVAIEEYGALRERHGFLRTQSLDLATSKDQLLAAINELNATSQQLFQETFDQVVKNFKFTFETLFGGGHADLQLIQSEDPLEAGIEIVARPPGTKLRSLSLLSGGQKTMTAVALLFAIYMVKPSPFCVLDELDAPLDDANVGRFTKILKEFTKYSQFLVITHNKRTISAADAIYGVTMPERGVTQMISMRFNTETGEVVNEKQEALALA